MLEIFTWVHDATSFLILFFMNSFVKLILKEQLWAEMSFQLVLQHFWEPLKRFLLLKWTHVHCRASKSWIVDKVSTSLERRGAVCRKSMISVMSYKMHESQCSSWLSATLLQLKLCNEYYLKIYNNIVQCPYNLTNIWDRNQVCMSETMLV